MFEDLNKIFVISKMRYSRFFKILNTFVSFPHQSSAVEFAAILRLLKGLSRLYKQMNHGVKDPLRLIKGAFYCFENAGISHIVWNLTLRGTMTPNNNKKVYFSPLNQVLIMVFIQLRYFHRWARYCRQVMGMLYPKINQVFYFTGPKVTVPNCPIEMLPHYNPSNGAQFFMQSDAECSKPTYFGLPFFLKDFGPVFQEWSVTGHESRPGHHTQVQGGCSQSASRMHYSIFEHFSLLSHFGNILGKNFGHFVKTYLR